jgi:succinyldiaminopimelate transaminase
MPAGEGFFLPPYPYDRLDEIAEIGKRHDGGLVDLSVGTPCDPPPPRVVEALSSSGAERGYPASVGSAAFRTAASSWVGRRFGVGLDPAHVAACVGTKELVATVAWGLRLRNPERDTVLHPSVAYPTYAFSAEMARCRALGVPERASGGMDLGSISEEDAARALVLWLNSPSNPTGSLTDLGEAAEWGRARGVPVFSDECYAELTWQGEPSTVLASGSEGVVAVHSLSKRSNLAGIRAGFFAGDPDIVSWLAELRRHAGLMVPGPVQAAAVEAFEDDAHASEQRERYRRRLVRLAEILRSHGMQASMPAGGLYLWVPVPEWATGKDPERPAWVLAGRLAEAGGMLVSPGDLYGEAGAGFVRVAAVQPDDRIELVAERLANSAITLG